MKRCAVLLLVVMFVAVLGNVAFARTRVERWMDVSGNYNYDGSSGLNWSATANGYLNFVMGVRKQLNTSLRVTVGQDGDNISNNQQVLVSADYRYNASRYTTFNLSTTGETFRRDSTDLTAYKKDVTVQTNALMTKYVSRRLEWKLGFEHWYNLPYDTLAEAWTAGTGTAKAVTKLVYTKPFGRYLKKANLYEELHFGRDLKSGGNNTFTTTTVFDYSIYRRMTLRATAIYVFDSPGSFGNWAKNPWDYKKIELLYHFY